MDDLEQPKGATTAQRILAVQRAIGTICRNARNDFHKYKYVSIDNIADKVSPLLAEHGLVVLSSVHDLVREGDTTTIRVMYNIFSADNPQDVFSVLIPGIANDKGDKALYKAYTGSRKYFYFQTFHVAFGDDPENEVAGATTNGGGAKTEPLADPLEHIIQTKKSSKRNIPLRDIDQKWIKHFASSPALLKNFVPEDRANIIAAAKLLINNEGN